MHRVLARRTLFMNKQALAFLTMFSLILMLSVYYVTLPSDGTKTVMKEETAKKNKSIADTTKKTDTSKDSDAKSDTSQSSGVVKLQESIDQKKEVEINKNNEVVANDTSDETAKKDALSKIDILKAQQTLQKTVVDALTKDGYKTAVEISDSTCIVNVFEQKDDSKVAKAVLMKTSSVTNNKYLIEVTFK